MNKMKCTWAAACLAAAFGAGAAGHPLVVTDGFSTNGAPVAVKLPLRITTDRQLVVIEGARNEEATADGEWWPENNTLERETSFTLKTGGKVPSFAQVCAYYADKPDTILFCELKTIERHDDWDIPGFRQDYVRAFGEEIQKIRPGFTNVVAFTTDTGLVDALLQQYPGCPLGMISRYRGGAANDYRLGSWARSRKWLWLDFKDTPVQTVRQAKDLGMKVILAPVKDEVEYRQAWLMGADAVLTANGRLDAFNKKPPKPRTDEIPSGAYCLGYTKCVVDERNITTDDIKFDFSDKSPSKWYNGQWFGKDKPPKSCYTNRWGFLEMESDCVMMSTPPKFGEKGLLPVLHGKDGFYIEFTVSLSDFHPSHACSLWMFPTDKLPGGGEVPWFMELDVDEAKFGMGLSGSLHSMGEGNPMHLSNFNNVRLTELDRTKPITFGAGFDPKSQQVTWWRSNQVNGEFDMAAGSPFVPKIAKDLDYFWLITCRGPQGHLKDTQPKYRKFVYDVRVFVPESSPIPAVGEGEKEKAKGEGEERTVAPRYTTKQTWMKGKPNGALAYAYTNEVGRFEKFEKFERFEGLKGAKGFYVEATFAPGANSKAALHLAPKDPKAWRMDVASVATDFGFEGTVRNRDTVSGLNLVNPNAKRYLKDDPAKPLTLGISYDPWNDHIVFWRNNEYVFQVETPYVPRGASADDYVLTIEGEPVSVKAYTAGEGDPDCPARSAAKSAKGVPNGAAAYGYTKAAIVEEKIMPDDISMDRKNPDLSKKWFNGYWYGRTIPDPSLYSVTNGVLNMHSSSYFMSAPYAFGKKGALPILSGKDGFYVECTMSYSRNDRLYNGAFWLMPTCKLQGGDHPEWFMELDVDEAKFGPGISGTIHNMGEGRPFRIQNWTNVMSEPIDRRIPHTLGAAYDPKTLTVSWWVNGRFSHRSEAPFVPTVVRDLEYFLIVEAEKRWIYPDYDCRIHSVKAYVPEL